MNLPLRVETILSMPFAENSYVVFRQGSEDCFIVDPGFEPESILDAIRRHRLRPIAILNTHGHADHIAGNQAMKQAYPTIPLIIGRNDAPMLTDAVLNLSELGGMAVLSPPADQLVDEGDRIELLGIELEVREIPGHSPGHVVYIWRDGQPPIVFGGDVLFAGSVGRFDFPGGDGRLLLQGIREKLYALPNDAVVFPGHGDPTTIGAEKASNPFTSGLYG